MAKHWTEDTALLASIAGNLYEALPLLPKRLVRLDAITREFDMPFSHIQILCLLSNGPMTIGKLSAALGIAKPNITPLVESLRARGLIERRRSELDRRIVHVQLCPAGADTAARVRQRIGDQLLTWPRGLSHSDIKRLNNALSYLIETARYLADAETNQPK